MGGYFGGCVGGYEVNHTARVLKQLNPLPDFQRTAIVNSSETLEKITQGVNYSTVILGLSIAAAIYGFPYFSVLLLFLSGVMIEKISVKLSKSDFVFILFVSAIFSIALISAIWRDAGHELFPLTIALALIVFLFFLIKINYEYLHQAIGLIAACYIISSLDLLLSFLIGDKSSSLELIENSITAALVVPNDYALFAIALPLFSYSIKCLFGAYAGRIIPWLYILGVVTAAILNSRLCALLMLIALVFEYRLLKSFINIRSLAILIPVAVICIILAPEFFAKVQSLPTSRIPLWNAAIHQIILHPLIGMGLDSFSDYYASHIVTTSYPDLITVDSRLMPWPHNIFLEISAAYGILAAVILVMGLVACFAFSSKLTIPLVLPSRLSLCLFIVAGMFELTYLRIYPVLILVFLIGAMTASANKHEGLG
jgi:O-antigen ligase